MCKIKVCALNVDIFRKSKWAPASCVSVVINDALDRATVAQDTHSSYCRKQQGRRRSNSS